MLELNDIISSDWSVYFRGLADGSLKKPDRTKKGFMNSKCHFVFYARLGRHLVIKTVRLYVNLCPQSCLKH